MKCLPATGSASCRRPIPARSKWRCGRCSARGPVTTIAWESFGEGWVSDIVKELKLKDVTKLHAGYGDIPDLSKADPASDIVFTWNGTTSGVRVPNADWIKADRAGLTICDATSAAFAQPLDWPKLDVVTFSWQKALGGEAAHGMLILSPRAVERLETYTPAWPLPKIFRMTKGGKLNEGIFEGETINTPSMLCVEDYLDALNWAKSIGGLKALIARADANTKALADWKAKTPWIDFLAKDRLDPLQHLGVPEDRRSRDHLADRRMRRLTSPRSWSRWSRRKAPVTTSPITAMRPRACGSGAAPPWRRPTSRC